MSASNFQIVKTKLRLSSLILVVGVGGCGTHQKSKDQELQKTREELNKNIKEYKELASSYNNLADDAALLANGLLVTLDVKKKRDEMIKNAGVQLNNFDLAVGEFTEILTSADSAIDSKDCKSASNQIEKGRTQISTVSEYANKLSQGGLAKAIAAIIEEEKAKSDSPSLGSLRVLESELTKGLSGTKSLVVFAFNQTVDKYNSVCATKTTPVSSAGTTRVASGTVVSVSSSGSSVTMTPTELKNRYRGTYDEDAYSSFSALAEGSGGVLGFSPSAELFSSTVDAILKEIEKVPGTVKDIAIVLDTTSSMHDDIENVKANMSKIIEGLKKSSSLKSVRLALVLFRDVGTEEEYVTRVVSDFTSDLDSINSSIRSTSVSGGGDTPEAVIDALETAKDKLSWSSAASKAVILIGDAPAQPKSQSKKDLTTIISEYKNAGLGIVIYPILLNL